MQLVPKWENVHVLFKLYKMEMIDKSWAQVKLKAVGKQNNMNRPSCELFVGNKRCWHSTSYDQVRQTIPDLKSSFDSNCSSEVSYVGFYYSNQCRLSAYYWYWVRSIHYRGAWLLWQILSDLPPLRQEGITSTSFPSFCASQYNTISKHSCQSGSLGSSLYVYMNDHMVTLSSSWASHTLPHLQSNYLIHVKYSKFKTGCEAHNSPWYGFLIKRQKSYPPLNHSGNKPEICSSYNYPYSWG